MAPISEWSAKLAAEQAKKNAIILTFGVPKTGKSELGTSTKLPLFTAHLDMNDNLQEHLLARHQKYPDAFTAEPLYIRPVQYKNLTRDQAKADVERLETYAAEARAWSRANGPGLFFIDGGKRLRGLVEKALLGDSATLGFRPGEGEKGILPIQYGQSNAYFNDIINAFVGSDLHLMVSFEARQIWGDAQDERGRKTRRPTGKYEPAMSSGRENEIAYTVNALIEVLVEAERGAVVDNKQLWNYVHKIRFEYLGFVGMDYLRNRTMPTPDFDTLLDLLHSNIPAADKLDPPHPIQRIDMDDGLDAAPEEGAGE